METNDRYKYIRNIPTLKSLLRERDELIADQKKQILDCSADNALLHKRLKKCREALQESNAQLKFQKGIKNRLRGYLERFWEEGMHNIDIDFIIQNIMGEKRG